MCGVIAAIGADAVKLARRGTTAMAHRGVRAKIHEHIRGAIGHVRLPIVGVGDWNDQPMKRGDFTVAFVGEILDFRDEDPGMECDAEFVADQFAKHGTWSLRDRDGFWSVVAYDRSEGAIHAFVDYLAQKPLYYRDDYEVRAVASEIDALAGLSRTTPDEVYLSACVKWGYCPEGWRTPHKEIRKLAPGHALHMSDRAPVGDHTTYEVDPLATRSCSPRSLRQAIERATERRMVSSDVPVSALVSGGLDSSIVYKLAQRYGDISHTFHVPNGPEDRDAFNEITQGDPNAYMLPTFAIDLKTALEYMQEPIDLGSLLPQVALSDAIGDKSDVCLTGDGADELFGGYSRAARYDSQASDVYHELVSWHLPRLDRVMMRNRVEVRSPFLAREVVEMALGLPRSYRIDKLALREAFRFELPESICRGTKRALRTDDVANNRPDRSLELVNLLREKYW